MAVSVYRGFLRCDAERVWKTVTSAEGYPQWRSDLARTEIAGEGMFVEYGKNGFPTFFAVKRSLPCACWELELKNENMEGRFFLGINSAQSLYSAAQICYNRNR